MTHKCSSFCILYSVINLTIHTITCKWISQQKKMQRTNIINIITDVCQMPRDEEGMNKIAIFVSILVIVPPTRLLPDNLTTACQSFRKFWSYQETYLSFLRNTFKHVLKIKKYQLLDYRMYSDKIKESLISPPQPPHSIQKKRSEHLAKGREI